MTDDYDYTEHYDYVKATNQTWENEHVEFDRDITLEGCNIRGCHVVVCDGVTVFLSTGNILTRNQIDCQGTGLIMADQSDGWYFIGKRTLH